jgi:hypothetical protein
MTALTFTAQQLAAIAALQRNRGEISAEALRRLLAVAAGARPSAVA